MGSVELLEAGQGGRGWKCSRQAIVGIFRYLLPSRTAHSGLPTDKVKSDRDFSAVPPAESNGVVLYDTSISYTL